MQCAKNSGARPTGGEINDHRTVASIADHRPAREVAQKFAEFDIEQLTEPQEGLCAGPLAAGLKSPQLIDANRSGNSEFSLVDAENCSSLLKTFADLAI